MGVPEATSGSPGDLTVFKLRTPRRGRVLDSRRPRATSGGVFLRHATVLPRALTAREDGRAGHVSNPHGIQIRREPAAHGHGDYAEPL